MGELMREAFREIAASPMRYVAELIQFAVLIGLIVWFGRGKVRKRLADRQGRIAAELAEAENAVHESARIRDEARALAERPPEEGPALLRRAAQEAVSQRDAEVARLEADAAEILAQAQRTVEREKERISRESASRLVQLTTETVRRYIDEMLTESERRTVTQQAILASLDELEHGAPSGKGAA